MPSILNRKTLTDLIEFFKYLHWTIWTENMSPGPQELSAPVEARGQAGALPAPDTVVISGMSGLLPSCHNIPEFAEKLYAKENLVKKYEPDQEYRLPDLPPYTGHVPGLAQFDAQFFMVHYRLCQTMDAMGRKVLENTYQAIYDAGLSPAELSSKRVAVYIAVGSTESEKGASFAEVGMGLLGCNRTMIANRVSYWLNSKGPSQVLDASCCGALVAFEKGYEVISSGECDAAIVGASKVLLHPQTLIHYNRLVPNNKDGKTKCYDTNADGQASSEAITVFLLQRYKDSKRVYASLCYAKSQFGVVNDDKYAERYGPGGDPQSFARFLHEFYDEIGIPPSVVEYVEGFGAALPDVDKMELQVMDEVFCKDRVNPLLVGSVMSNIGYTEAATGSSAIIKILLAYHRGEIPATLHCESPRQDVAALREGRLRIVTDRHGFGGGLAAVNGLSVTGLHGHALLSGHHKPKDLSRYHSEIPYLVTVSGRQESAVKKILDHLKSSQLDAEEVALLHNIHKYRINGHMARGYGIFTSEKDNSTSTLREEVDYFDDAKRPLWFVYSGMGSQWAGMGAQLMRIPIFAAAIERCHKVLEPKGIDIYQVITTLDKSVFDNILNSFVGIAAVQIGLTDVLTSIGLVPDKIIGHSVGELGCAYADGCFTAEEMVLAAYSRGLVSIETPFIAGSMAAVGLGYAQISSICPPEIEVACHNGPDSSTISGPAIVMREFVSQLTSKGIFAKEVQCSNIAFHSRYIAKAGPGLLQYLSETIKSPKLRSQRWVSTSVPQERWHEDDAKYSSAEYHTNNLLNPVLFEETVKLVPSNAVLVEIAPHGLLQAILKRSLSASCKNIALAVRGHTDNALFLLEAIGKLYINGYVPDISALYPPVEFPVSTGTPMLSHLTEWVHTENWNLCRYISTDRTYSAVYKPIITIFDDEFLAGHVINGRRYYPFAAILVLAWDTLAMTLSKPRRTLPVQFRDVHLNMQPSLLDHEALHLTVALHRGSGRFEVSYEYGVIAEGIIVAVSDTFANLDYERESLTLTSNDIYKLLHERGYEYKEEFRSIHKTNLTLDQAEMIWKNNWVTLIDGLFQLNALGRLHDAISQVSHIKSLNIRPKLHLFRNKRDGQEYFYAKLFKNQETTQCGGVVINNITFVDKPPIRRSVPTLKGLQFIPFFLQDEPDITTTLYIFMQIIAENIISEQINVVDIISSNRPSIMQRIEHLIDSPPKIKHSTVRIHKSELVKLRSMKSKPDVLIVYDQFIDKSIFEVLYHCLSSNTFIVSIGIETENLYPTAFYRPVCARGLGPKKLELALWRPSTFSSTTSLTIGNASEIDLFQSTCSNLPPQHRVLVMSPSPPLQELKYIIKQQKRDNNRKINVVMIDHKGADAQELDHLPNFDLTYNLLKHGKWGGDYYVPLTERMVNERPVALKSAQIGDLDSLCWVEAPEVKKDKISVTVYYAAINAYDAKRARAELPVNNANEGYGMDFSGITDSGERVFGIVRNEAVSARVSARPELLWPVPEHWDLEDAATVALPYLQAFYCLAIKTQLREGMRVLIHGGAGALGQAAISIALAMRCEVFTTVSDVRKKNFLKQLFPSLKGSHIGNSRDISFSDMVLSATKGAGCHIVINNLKGELKNASLKCCASYGTTLDVVQIHTREKYSYGMYNMTRARSYVPIDFSAIIEDNNLEELKKLKLLVSEGIVQGYVRPLSRVAYGAHSAARAFRLLAASNHRGRVLLRIADANAPPAKPTVTYSGTMQQLLISDEDVVAPLLADRLINQGAKFLRLYLPHPSGYLNVKKAAWSQRGVEVDSTYGEAWKKQKLLQFLYDSQQKGDVESLFFIIRRSEETSILKSILQNFDMTSRTLMPSLRHFTIIGESHQFGREICRDRAFYGLPSLSLQLENIEQFNEVGIINDHVSSNEELKGRNTIEIIEKAICSNEAVIYGYAQSKKRRTLLEEIALIPGVRISSATDLRSTLEQVGIDQGRAPELCYMLEEKFHIILQKESLPNITLAKFKHLQEKIENKVKEELGIPAYFKAIEPNELVATAEIVLMYTLGRSSDMVTDEFDANETYLCIVPGVEGYHKRFEVLCERLKLPAVVLQPSVDVLDDTVQGMAQRLTKVMVQTFGHKKRFYLLGYELGILVALEMAAILESYGSTGIIYCLGGTPYDIQTSLQLHLGKMSDENLQNSLVQHLTALMMNASATDLPQDLKATCLEDKIDTCVKRISGKVSYTCQFTKSYLKAAYNRIKLIRSHRIRPGGLLSQIVVLRAMLPWPSSFNSMQDFSDQPLIVHELQDSLAQVPNNLQCAAIINKYLDSEIIEKFETRNLCETHLLDIDMFTK